LRALVEEARETPAPPAEPQEPPVTGPLVNESFNPAAPTLKTGEPLTADQRTYHTAFTRAFYRSDPVAELSITREFGRGDRYHLGRWGQTIQDPALQVLARTGDGGILDRLTVGWRLAYDDLVVEWDARNLDETYIRDWAGAKIVDGKWVLSGGKTPWSPY